jgi:hypothetical protein
MCRSENDLRRATTIAQREKGLSDIVRAASPGGQGELFAIQFRERKLARYRTGSTLKIAPVSIRNSSSIAPGAAGADWKWSLS